MAKTSVLELPCEFTGLTGGKETCGLGIKVPRSALSLDRADDLFVNRQLTCKLILKRRKDADDQTQMMEVALELDGLFTTSKLGANGTHFTTKLTANSNSVAVAELFKFSNREGFVHVMKDEDPPAKAPKGDKSH